MSKVRVSPREFMIYLEDRKRQCKVALDCVLGKLYTSPRSDDLHRDRLTTEGKIEAYAEMIEHFNGMCFEAEKQSTKLSVT